MKKSIEGTVKFFYSAPENQKCACCENGKHIYGRNVIWKNNLNHLKEQGDIQDFQHKYLSNEGKNLDGKTVYLTITDIDEQKRIEDTIEKVFKESLEKYDILLNNSTLNMFKDLKEKLKNELKK